MVASRRKGVWLAALAIALAVGARADDGGPTARISPIATLRAPASRVGPKNVVVRGRLTWVARGRSGNEYAAVQDDTAGIWLDVQRAKDSGTWQGEDAWRTVEPGMLVEVEGVRDRDDQTFAPQIVPLAIKPLAPPTDVELPAALPTTADRLFSGLDDSQRITIEGVVQGLAEQRGRWLITLEAGGRRIRIRAPKDADSPTPSLMVDATLQVTGVATTSYTTRGQFVLPTIMVPRSCDMRVVSPAPTAAFDAPEIPLERLGRLIPGVDVRHRIRTRGTVSYASETGLFYLQSRALGVRVEASETADVRPGDMVEVSGFLDRERVLAGLSQAAGIVNAVVKVVGRSSRPTATVIQPDRIVEINRAAQRNGRLAEPGDYDGCLIECRARVGDLRADADGIIPLIAGSTALTATLSEDVRSDVAALEPGCELVVRGIVQFELEPPVAGTLPRLGRMTLLVPSAADITVVSRPSWWTPRRLLAVLGMLAVAFAVALGWVGLLRREVAVQSRRLAAEITERQRAEIEFEAALEERSRLAANLHDTVLQTVTGIGYQLKSVQQAAEQPLAADPESLATAQRMVEHAVHQLRGKVWSMRMMPREGQTFPAALEALAARLQVGQAPRIVVHVAGVEREMPDIVSGNLLLLAEEAIHNALKHARATTIDAMALYDDDSVGVVIHDDGAGFHVATEGTEPPGHFGLAGMRERMRRLRGRVTVESSRSEGTTVTATVPAERSRAALSARPVSPDGLDA
jgi:signal transduction histidine kinase